MERKFFMDDFEESLKGHADQFKMIPSKKVWHGIYNDLHPGRRWPSVTISLLLIFILLGVGYLNTHNSAQTSLSISKKTIALNNSLVQPKTEVGDEVAGSTVAKEKLTEQSNAGTLQNTSSSGKISSGTKPLGNTPNEAQREQLLADKVADSKSTDNTSKITYDNTNGISNARSRESSVFIPSKSILSNTNADLKANEVAATSTITEGDQKQMITVPASRSHAEQMINGEIVIFNAPGFFPSPGIASNIVGTQKVDKSIAEILESENKKLVIEKMESNSAAKKTSVVESKKILKLHKKKNEKVNWVYYAAPLISAVTFSGQAIKEVPSTNFSIALAANQKENKVLHNPLFGFEAGAQMEYNLTKKLQFITGVHLTYSGYKIISNEVHPTFATLILRDPKNGMDFPMSYLSHYGDGTGQTPVSLRNYNWQLSIPLGVQYQLSGNNKIQFHAGANVEPSYVLKSNAFVLSSDGRNYVNDPSLLRKWNMSSNFNAFITFRAHNFRWNIGPNVRYQWFSTYQNTYTIKEHLIDYGIRIGISK